MPSLRRGHGRARDPCTKSHPSGVRASVVAEKPGNAGEQGMQEDGCGMTTRTRKNL